MIYSPVYLASTYGSGNYDSSTYNGSSTGTSTGSTGSGSTRVLTNTGFDVLLSVIIAAVIIFVALVVHFKKRPRK